MLQGSADKHARLSIPVYIVLLILLVVTSILSPTFRTVDNAINVFNQVAPLAIASIGQTIVLLLAGIDLSVGSVISISTVIMALISSTDTAATLIGGIILALITGTLVGIINGLGIIKLNIPPLIMTLSTMSIVKGVALFLMPSPGGMVSLKFLEFITFRWGIVNNVIILIIVLYMLFYMILSSTSLGRYIYATGGNLKNARTTGIPVEKITVVGYAFSGLMAATAGIVLSARIFSGDAIVGDPYSLDSIAASVVGGTSLLGGIGGVLGSLAGAFLISLTNNVMNMLNIFAYYQYIVKGFILVMALFLFQLRGRKNEL